MPVRDTGLRYWVSSHGMVHGPLGLTLGSLRDNGYRFADVSQYDRRWTIGVHRLVCVAFHGDPPTAEHQACHWDGVRDNNRADNLRWGTPLENAADRVRHGRYHNGDRNVRARLTNDQAAEIRRRVQAGGVGNQIAAEFGVSPMTVSNIKLGKAYR